MKDLNINANNLQELLSRNFFNNSKKNFYDHIFNEKDIKIEKNQLKLILIIRDF